MTAGLQCESMVRELRDSYRQGITKSYKWRAGQLTALIRLLQDNRGKFEEALRHDLRKPAYASNIDEIEFCINEAVYAINNLKKWMEPEKAAKDMLTMLDGVFIQREPFGVVLNLGAWNYPVQLAFAPLVAIIAAGNCCVLKPSECSDATAQLIEDLFPKYMDERCLRVINGGVDVATALLNQQWDHIMYTGSSRVAKIVMKAASEHVTPVTLELGGKCPAYVDSSCDLPVVANRLVWGKYKNAGQTCIAPDYVLCSADVQTPLIQALKASLNEFYGPDPKVSPDFERLQNDRHYSRTKALLESCGGTIAHGGDTDDKDRYISPTIVTGVRPDSTMATEEIFGPILYFVTVRDVDAAINHINGGHKPLAIYAFSKRDEVRQAFTERTSSGSLTVNDLLMGAAIKGLPFGGVGNSGIGSYHGKHGFLNFSHSKACLYKKQNIEGLYKTMRYPPYTDTKYKRVSWLTTLTVRGPFRRALPKLLLLGAILALVAIVAASAYVLSLHFKIVPRD